MVGYAFDLSEKLGEPVLFRTTTRINHSSGIVTLNPITPPVTKGDFTKDPLNLVPVPVVARKLHVRLLDNMAKAQDISEESEYNFTEGDGPWGIICSGVSYNYVHDMVDELGIADKTTVLRLGFSYPLPEKRIKELLKRAEKVLIVEEGEPIMEEAIKALAQEEGLTLPIKGKTEIGRAHG